MWYTTGRLQIQSQEHDPRLHQTCGCPNLWASFVADVSKILVSVHACGLLNRMPGPRVGDPHRGLRFQRPVCGIVDGALEGGYRLPVEGKQS